MRKLYIEGIFSTPYFLLSQGIVFSSMAIRFGLKGLAISIAASLPVSLQVLQLISPYLSEKFGSRKKVALMFGGSSKVIWPLILSLMLLSGDLEPLKFVLWFAITQAMASIGNSAWISWIRELIPENVRGKVLGTRNLLITVMSMILVYVFTNIMERFKDLGYVIVTLTTLTFSIASVQTMAGLKDAPLKRTGFLASLLKVSKDENFMKLVGFFSVWNFVVMFSAAFFPYHLIKVLDVPLDYIGLMSVISGLILMVFYRIYGELSDRIGHKSVAEIGVMMVSVTAMMWLFMDERSYTKLLVVDAVLTGIGWSAVNLALTTLPMEVASGTEQAYFSLYYAMGGIGGMLGAIAGGFLGNFLSHRVFDFGGWDVHGLQLMFFLCGFARISTLSLLYRVEVKRYIPVKRMVFNYLALVARRVPARPIEHSIGVIRSRLRRLRRSERENDRGEG